MQKVLCLLWAFALFQASLISADPQLHICTVASQRNKGLDQLLDSCDRYGLSIDVMGMGQPFKGNSHKLMYVQDYIQNLDDNDVVLFVDAYDVLFFADADKILQTFLNIDKPFVISVERYCWPYPNLEPSFPRGPTSFRYINSGSYMGYVYRLKEILNDIQPKPFQDDQGLFTRHYFENPDLYTFDAYCELFMPFAGVIMQELHIDPSDDTVVVNETGIKPCMIHGNGGSRPMYQEIYDLLYLLNVAA
ncbi:MAG: hypothetical protein H0U49_05505 [Parachlamydiaceae bacterium]|nr:hypothetical protein [Parachlamydiaceae bacterium]